MSDALPMFWCAWILTTVVGLSVVACGDAEPVKRGGPFVCPVEPKVCPDKLTHP